MLVICAGTTTEVGKTWVGAAVLEGLRLSGVSVAARKPAQSFGPAAGRPTDREILAQATGETPDDVCPPHRTYPRPYPPPMAAAALGLGSFVLDDVVAETRWPDPVPAVKWIEAVGGVRTPLAEDADTVAFCERLEPDLVVLVSGSGSGAVNAVTLCSDVLAPHPVVVMLNHYDAQDELHRRNREWLSRHLGLDVITTPRALIDSLLQGAEGRPRTPS